MARKYTPRRSSARWLEGAPNIVLACYDYGEKSFDRYTILLNIVHEGPRGNTIAAFAASEQPSHPQGFGQHTDIPAYSDRKCLGKKITWAELPEAVRNVITGMYKEA